MTDTLIERFRNYLNMRSKCIGGYDDNIHSIDDEVLRVTDIEAVIAALKAKDERIVELEEALAALLFSMTAIARPKFQDPTRFDEMRTVVDARAALSKANGETS